MSESNIRMERVQRLIHELEYEIMRGIMENEIDESIAYQKIACGVSRSIPDGSVVLEIRSRPVPRGYVLGMMHEKTRLTAVK